MGVQHVVVHGSHAVLYSSLMQRWSSWVVKPVNEILRMSLAQATAYLLILGEERESWGSFSACPNVKCFRRYVRVWNSKTGP